MKITTAYSYSANVDGNPQSGYLFIEQKKMESYAMLVMRDLFGDKATLIAIVNYRTTYLIIEISRSIILLGRKTIQNYKICRLGGHCLPLV